MNEPFRGRHSGGDRQRLLVYIWADAPARTAGARLSCAEQVCELPPPEIGSSRRVQVWLEAAALLRQELGSDIFIRGNCDQSPFTLASMVRGSEAWLLDLLDADQHGHVRLLLEHCTKATIQFIRLMAATGVHMVSNGDSFAGPELISPALYREFALPYEQLAARAAHDAGLPYVLHICGNTGPILPGMLATGADGLEIDYKTDSLLAHRLMAGRAVFIGNIDPSGVLALGTRAEVERKTRELLEIFADTPRFILNAGCAIPPVTPPENLQAMIRTAQTFGRS